MRAERRATAEIERLRALAPLPAPSADDAYDDIRDNALLAQILAPVAARTPVVPVPRRAAPAPAPRRRRTGLRVGLVAGLAVAAAVVAVQLPSARQPADAEAPTMLVYADGTPADVLAGTLPDARSALTDLSRAAAGGDVVQTEGTQFVETYNWFMSTSVSADGARDSSIAPVHLRLWLAPDGSVRTEEHREGSFGPQGELQAPPSTGGQSPEVAGDNLPPGSLDAGTVRALPRDPVALRAALLAQMPLVDCTGDAAAAACLSSEIVGLYNDFVIPSDLASAFWQVLADEPAMRLLGGVTDRVGRTGVAVASPGPWSSPQHVSVLIVDPTTGQLIGAEDVTEDDGAPSGLIASSVQIWMRSAVVGALGDLP